MKHQLCVFIICVNFFSSHVSFAQDFSKWKKQEVTQAKTASDAGYLSDNEKQVVFFMNLARSNGKKFFDTYIQVYLSRFNQIYQGNGIKPDNEYLKSLKKDLYKIKNLPPFIPLEGLTAAARYHAKDMGSYGAVGHESTNGMTASERGEKFAGTPYVGENCSYGFEDPLYIVGHLLLDDGVPSLGHRTNILDSEYRYYAVGVAIEAHKEYQYNCVIDFAVKSDDMPETYSYEGTDNNGSDSGQSRLSAAELGVQSHLEMIDDKGYDIMYSYEGGLFLLNRKTNDWREQTDQGSVFYFKEESNKKGRLVLFDNMRRVWLRIDTGKAICEYSENGTDWSLLYYLRRH